MCIILIGSDYIVPEIFSRVCSQIFSGTYPKRTYTFASPAGLWKVMARVAVFLIPAVVINTFTGFNAVPHVLQVFSFVGKCWL